jgi:hypothetical protein
MTQLNQMGAADAMNERRLLKLMLTEPNISKKI